MRVGVPIEPFVGQVLGAWLADVNLKYIWDVTTDIAADELAQLCQTLETDSADGKLETTPVQAVQVGSILERATVFEAGLCDAIEIYGGEGG